MSLISRIKTWVSNEVLTASDLNGEFDNIINNMDASSIAGVSSDATEMQSTVNPGTTGSESLAGDMAGEIKRLRYMIQALSGGANWYNTKLIQTAGLNDSAVTTAKIADANVTTAKLANGAVTQAKREALPDYISSSCGSFTYAPASTAISAVTNLSVSSVVTTGRPVMIELVGDGTTNGSFVGLSRTAEEAGIDVLFYRDTTLIHVANLHIKSGNAANVIYYVPSSSFRYKETPAAGNYTYTIKTRLESGQTTNSATAIFSYCKLNVYEM